jgi:heme exporter protein A
VTAGAASPAAIEAVDLTRRFGAIPALAGVSLRVECGDALALFGPNGAGKTTLLRILTLGLRPTSGAVRVLGLEPRTRDREIRGRIGTISHASLLYDDLTTRQNLEFWARLYGATDPRNRVRQVLDTVGLGSRADDPVGTLSRGLQQRASLARALVHDPEIVILDEPFTGLDPHGARALCQTLAALGRSGRTVVLATHDLRQGLELSNRWVLLARGRIVAHGVSADTDPATFEDSYVEHVSTRPARRGAG